MVSPRHDPVLAVPTGAHRLDDPGAPSSPLATPHRLYTAAASVKPRPVSSRSPSDLLSPYLPRQYPTPSRASPLCAGTTSPHQAGALRADDVVASLGPKGLDRVPTSRVRPRCPHRVATPDAHGVPATDATPTAATSVRTPPQRTCQPRSWNALPPSSSHVLPSSRPGGEHGNPKSLVFFRHEPLSAPVFDAGYTLCTRTGGAPSRAPPHRLGTRGHIALSPSTYRRAAVDCG